jgi:hypothetical protein
MSGSFKASPALMFLAIAMALEKYQYTAAAPQATERANKIVDNMVVSS